MVTTCVQEAHIPKNLHVQKHRYKKMEAIGST